MVSAMKAVLEKADMKVLEKIDLWQNDEFIYKMQSKFGEFELSTSNYGGIFILAPDNQLAIESLGALFSHSEHFQSEVVDFAQYT